MPVTQLGYLNFEVVDLAAWASLASDVLGCHVDGPSAGVLGLRLDDRPFRCRLYEGESDRLTAIGFEVASSAELNRICEKAVAWGADVRVASNAEMALRAVGDLAALIDPAGFTCELFVAAGSDDRPVSFGRSMSGFATGDQGMGHVVLAVSEFDEMIEFYTEVLGFRVSDFIDLGGTDAVFLHCNPRHHTVAFIRQPAQTPAAIHHFMLEVNCLDDVGVALDRCAVTGVPVSLSLGRHTNDHMTSFYLTSPSGFFIEYGFGGLAIDRPDEWVIGHYSAPSTWGHQPPSAWSTSITATTEKDRDAHV